MKEVATGQTKTRVTLNDGEILDNLNSQKKCQ